MLVDTLGFEDVKTWLTSLQSVNGFIYSLTVDIENTKFTNTALVSSRVCVCVCFFL